MSSLGNDLATIRKQQHYSLEEIQEATKIPLHILQAIENDTIVDLEENTTYIRSYIRSYAKTLKLDDHLVVKALDQMEEGTYSGLLIQQHESASQEESGPDVEEYDSDVKDMVHDHAPNVEPSTSDRINPPVSDQRVPPPPSINSVDWADMGRKFTPLQNRSRMWIGVLIFVIIIAAVIFLWFYQNNVDLLSNNETVSNPSQNLSQQAIVPDSLQLNLSDAESAAPVEASTPGNPTTLSDTLTMLIYAAYGKLEPVRVYTDLMDEINPYWIEQGEAYRFPFVNLVRIRGQYSRMELLVNGHPIENFRDRFLRIVNIDSQFVEIDRSLFENNDKWLQPPPDSTALGFSPPNTVLDRPVFN